MKCFNSASRVAFLLLAILGLTRAVAAGQKVPMKGSLQGTHTVVIVPPIGTFDAVGTGVATHLGRFTYDYPHTVNFATHTAIGTYTFTAANGDTLTAEVVDNSDEPVEPGIIFVIEELEITGGTGRFAGATGELTLLRLVDQINLTTIGTIEGTISSGK